MRALVGGDISKQADAMRRSGFPISSGLILGGKDTENLKGVRCPETLGAARTGIYLMHVPKAECIIIASDGRDDELLNLALSFGKPTFVLYSNTRFTAGLLFNYAEDF